MQLTPIEANYILAQVNELLRKAHLTAPQGTESRAGTTPHTPAFRSPWPPAGAPAGPLPLACLHTKTGRAQLYAHSVQGAELVQQFEQFGDEVNEQVRQSLQGLGHGFQDAPFKEICKDLDALKQKTTAAYNHLIECQELREQHAADLAEQFVLW